MRRGTLNVLLIGENWSRLSAVVRRLEGGGCRCQFAQTYSEARRLVETETIELVLSAIPPREREISSLAAALEGTHAHIFYVLPVESGCWWLPALRDGIPCLGAAALRPKEFTRLLEEVIEEAFARQAERQETPQSVSVSPRKEPAIGSREPVMRHSAAAA
jgi:DNA-binding NtrC family response regulator